MPAGSVWECPQLFQLDGSWVLLVSVWDDVPGGVACAVGDYDGRRFTPRAWHRLAADPLYATTTFLDAAGRRCALSWLQEPGPAEGDWAGALTVPWLLTLEGDRVGVRPHPDVDSLRTGVRTDLGPAAPSTEPVVIGSPDAQFDLVLRAVPGGRRLTLTLDDPVGELFSVVLDPGAGEAGVVLPDRAGRTVPLLPGVDGAVELRVLADASVRGGVPGWRCGRGRPPAPSSGPAPAVPRGGRGRRAPGATARARDGAGAAADAARP